MPVARGVNKSSRQAILLVVAGLMGVIALIVVVTQITSQTADGGVTINVGDQKFRPGPAETIAELIDDGGPLLLSDVASGDRDLIVQHIGDDPQTGWFAFAPRPADAARDCAVQWQDDDEVFNDPCDGTQYPAEGTGLTSYPVVIDTDGILVIDLNAESRDG